MLITPIILCGGFGTRLWPLSRAEYPKQFLPLFEEQSLFQKTILRVSDSQYFTKAICVTNNDHCFTVNNQLSDIAIKSHILLEPCLKNTAAAIAAATLYAKEINGEDCQILILPSDHYIKDNQQFLKTILSAKTLVDSQIVTFGITPTHPEIGFGYLKCSEQSQLTKSYTVDEFVEKPNLNTAKQYIEKGNYFWNSGMFYFSSKTILEQMQNHCPDILNPVIKSIQSKQKYQEYTMLGSDFEKAVELSIDYAVMEKSNNLSLVPLNAGWSDIGSFESLAKQYTQDKDDNTIKGNTVSIDSKNNLIFGDKRLIATLGIESLNIIDTPDALLVSAKERSLEIGQLVKAIKITNNEIVTHHQKVHRPWGWYETLLEGMSFKVKRIHIYPQSQLSLQKHRYRSEHWVVVCGIAIVVCDDQEYQLQTNQSGFIPLGAVHRLKNDTDKDLQIIEVQNGSYLGEDDIIRIEDDYHRN